MTVRQQLKISSQQRTAIATCPGTPRRNVPCLCFSLAEFGGQLFYFPTDAHQPHCQIWMKELLKLEHNKIISRYTW